MILCLFLYYAAWQLSARDLLCAPLNLKTSSSWTIQELQTAATKRNRKAPPKRKNESSWWSIPGSVCKVRTQDPENFDEEVKSLVTAWLIYDLFIQFSVVSCVPCSLRTVYRQHFLLSGWLGNWRKRTLWRATKRQRIMRAHMAAIKRFLLCRLMKDR